MINEKTRQIEIENFISSFLRHRVGERPKFVNAKIRRPFLVIHLMNFLLESEKMLLKRKETLRVARTREIVMNEIKPELIRVIEENTGYGVKEFYTDWNFEKESGLLLIVLDMKSDLAALLFPEDISKEALHEKVNRISEKTQKLPDAIESYWIDDRTVVIERKGIMVDIEIELIKNGVAEELKLAKRPLEHRLMKSFELEPVLKQDVVELFVDWNFKEDKSYLVLILEPKLHEKI